MKHSGAFGRENVKERGVWLRKALQSDILEARVRALTTEIQR